MLSDPITVVENALTYIETGIDTDAHDIVKAFTRAVRSAGHISAELSGTTDLEPEVDAGVQAMHNVVQQWLE